MVLDGKSITSVDYVALGTSMYCRNANELLCVGLHWCVPFIEDLLETVQVVW